MKTKMKFKIMTDLAMTIVLLLLMTYGLIGEAAHEWLGIAMFALFVLHHTLNCRWSRNLLHRKKDARSILQTTLVILILLSMIGSMFSGIILSRYVFSGGFLSGWQSFARNLHMISAYGGFVLMSLHLGIHWSMIIGMGKRIVRKDSFARTRILRTAAVLIAGYGIYAFIYRRIWRYMFLMDHFVFFDFEEPLVRFIVDYMAVMGLFVFIGYYLEKGVHKNGWWWFRRNSD